MNIIGPEQRVSHILAFMQDKIDQLTSQNASTFSEVCDVVEGERAYQELRWGPFESHGKHEVASFVTFLSYHLEQATMCAATGERDVLDQVRKIAGLAIACLEQHGAPAREISEEVLKEAEAFLAKR